ncbi:MAG: radical SAM protein [Candidatus Thorarchaeota archaeon]
MRSVRKTKGESLLVGQMPAGCKMCALGTKMVLFVTGLCDSACFYCPLSQDKAGNDVVFADEMPVHNDNDILEELEAIGAEGAGFSGGDPLCRLQRTLGYISLLKDSQGDDFHIHLYTSQSDADMQQIKNLYEVGLDEIRFHPMTDNWSAVETAVGLGMDVGIEVPAIPGEIESLKKTAKRAEAIGVSFLNINELESSETNFESLSSLGLRLRNMESASIAGSAELAEEIIKWSAEELETISVHYCSAHFKDAIQMRNRLERRLERTAREFEERADDDPLLILGVIRAPFGEELDNEMLSQIREVLESQFDVPSTQLNIDLPRRRIEIAGWILAEIAQDLRSSVKNGDALEIGIAYEYPSWDRLQTLFDPL